VMDVALEAEALHWENLRRERVLRRRAHLVVLASRGRDVAEEVEEGR